ncbi:MAG: hypothetical protein L0Z07_07185 [Planctomycetes bacterium]|nr:hypothetical protein [Planctomycetota bacterium]
MMDRVGQVDGVDRHAVALWFTGWGVGAGCVVRMVIKAGLHGFVGCRCLSRFLEFLLGRRCRYHAWQQVP